MGQFSLLRLFNGFFCRALEILASLGGEDLIPFYDLIDGGRNGEFFAELEDYFYYSQMRKYVDALIKFVSYQATSCLYFDNAFFSPLFMFLFSL